MRDFLEYVERLKEDSPTTFDFYMESFASYIEELEGLDPIRTFILGYMIGKDIDIKTNSGYIKKLLSSDKNISNLNLLSGFTFSQKKDSSMIDETDLKSNMTKNLELKLKDLVMLIKNKSENKSENESDVN